MDVMSSKALMDAVAQTQTDNGDADPRFDVSGDVFDEFDARLEELHWRENTDGVLLVGDDARRPDTVVSIRLVGTTLDVTVEDPADIQWRRATVVSDPGRANTPQFD
jgi:hypothetical protein